MTIHDEEILGKAYDARLMRRLLTYLRPYWRQVIVALIAIIAGAGAQLAQPYLIKTAIDRHIATGQLAGLNALAAVYLVILVAAFAAEYIQTWTMQLTGQQIMFDLRMEIYRHLQRLDLAYYDRNPVGRLMTRVTSDVDVLNDLFTSGVVTVFGDVFTLVGIMGVMLWMNWRLALVAFSVLPLIVLVTQWFRRNVRDSYRVVRGWIARINAFLQENITGMATVQLFRRERLNFERFDDIDRKHRDANIESIFYYAVFYPAIEVVSSLASALIIWYGGGAVLRNTLTLGALVAFLQYSQRFFRPISDMSEKFNVLQSAMASSERIFKLIDEPVLVQEAQGIAGLKTGATPGRVDLNTGATPGRADLNTGATPGRVDLNTGATPGRADLNAGATPGRAGLNTGATPGRVDLNTGATPGRVDLNTGATPGRAGLNTGATEARTMRGHIVFHRVWFAYVGEDWVLKDVSFEVKPGERLGIVGATGSGKTTIINLLLRFYDVQRGRITVDGADVRDLPFDDLRALFSLVLQDVHLFSGTIAENIRLGELAISDDRVRRAAEAVHASAFVDRLPNGYASAVAERGSTLSVGQKQLLSFARALAFDPKILILDEATSSVDTETELLIRDALQVLMKGRTTIAIAHRLSTIQDMDNILVLHKGQLREAGTHQELLAQRGIYWRLYQLSSDRSRGAAAEAPATARSASEPSAAGRSGR